MSKRTHREDRWNRESTADLDLERGSTNGAEGSVVNVVADLVILLIT